MGTLATEISFYFNSPLYQIPGEKFSIQTIVFISAANAGFVCGQLRFFYEWKIGEKVCARSIK